MDMSEDPTSTPDRHLASGYLIADGHTADRSQGTIFILIRPHTGVSIVTARLCMLNQDRVL